MNQFNDIADSASTRIDRHNNDLVSAEAAVRNLAIFLGLKLIAYAIAMVAQAIKTKDFK